MNITRNEIRDRLEQWLTTVRSSAHWRDDSIVEVLLDELVPQYRGVPREEALAASYVLLDVAFEATAIIRKSHAIALQVELQPTRSLVTAAPDTAKLPLLMFHEQPSLYLIRRDVYRHMENIEEYRCPLLWPQLASICPWAVTYYHTVRQQASEEYGRFVVAEK